MYIRGLLCVNIYILLVSFVNIIIDFMLQLEWSQPQIQGDLVTPRAGHAGVAIDENWYIVGGGDNKSGKAKSLFGFLFFSYSLIYWY